MLHQSLVADDFHELHHATVFMSQDVAMQNEDAGEIDKPAADLHISGDINLFPILIAARRFSVWKIVERSRNRDGVVPDEVLLEDNRLLHRRGIEDFQDLKRVHVYVKRM